MEFFEKKEEILDLQLTPYGKELLSKGLFKPKFYAYYDDDILYDSGHAGFEESQNSAENRILNTGRLKLATALSNSNLEKDANSDDSWLTFPLGSSELGNQKAPSWSIRFFNENLIQAKKDVTGSFYSVNPIPQLNVNVVYRTTIGENRENLMIDDDRFIFEDDTFFITEKDDLFIKVEENNTQFTKENFEFEIYEVDGAELRALNFTDPGLDVNSVDYYLNILVDKEIDEIEFCQKVPEEERTLFYVDKVRNCEKSSEGFREDIYDEKESGELC